MKESISRIVEWAKAHPWIAAGVLLGVGIVAYLIYKSSQGQAVTPASLGANGTTDTGAASPLDSGSSSAAPSISDLIPALGGSDYLPTNNYPSVLSNDGGGLFNTVPLASADMTSLPAFSALPSYTDLGLSFPMSGHSTGVMLQPSTLAAASLGTASGTVGSMTKTQTPTASLGTASGTVGGAVKSSAQDTRGLTSHQIKLLTGTAKASSSLGTASGAVGTVSGTVKVQANDNRGVIALPVSNSLGTASGAVGTVSGGAATSTKK